MVPTMIHSEWLQGVLELTKMHMLIWIIIQLKELDFRVYYPILS